MKQKQEQNSPCIDSIRFTVRAENAAANSYQMQNMEHLTDESCTLYTVNYCLVQSKLSNDFISKEREKFLSKMNWIGDLRRATVFCF